MPTRFSWSLRAPVLAVLLLAGAVSASPPRITALTPTNGQTDLDPAAEFLRIEFDQDMDQTGYSLCGGGPSFPKLEGPGRWESPRVCVFRLRLQPGHDYRFSINCPSSQRFRNLAGEPVAVTPVMFRTGAGGPPPDRATQNRTAVERLRLALDEHYSYRDRVVADWPARFAAATPRLVAAGSPRDFAHAAAALLQPAADPHLYFRLSDGAMMPTSPLTAPANADLRRLSGSIAAWQEHNAAVCTGRLADDIGYILIKTWQGDATNFEPARQAALEMRGTRAIIVDVRFNTGGDERHAQAFAQAFTRERTAYAQHRVRTPGRDVRWQPIQRRYVEPGAAPYAGKVAVLMGARCLSSNEAFLLMMRHAARARLFGERSHGSSGNPQPFDLRNGVTIMVPSWEAQDPHGTLLEGRGVEPDQRIVFDPAGTTDAVLEAARQWAREG